MTQPWGEASRQKLSPSSRERRSVRRRRMKGSRCSQSQGSTVVRRREQAVQQCSRQDGGRGDEESCTQAGRQGCRRAVAAGTSADANADDDFGCLEGSGRCGVVWCACSKRRHARRPRAFSSPSGAAPRDHHPPAEGRRLITACPGKVGALLQRPHYFHAQRRGRRPRGGWRARTGRPGHSSR